MSLLCRRLLTSGRQYAGSVHTTASSSSTPSSRSFTHHRCRRVHTAVTAAVATTAARSGHGISSSSNNVHLRHHSISRVCSLGPVAAAASRPFSTTAASAATTNTNNKKERDPNDRRLATGRGKYYAAAFLAFSYYYVKRRMARDAALDTLDDVVAVDRREAVYVARNTTFTSQQLATLLAYAYTKFPVQWLTPDDFGRLVSEFAESERQRQRNERSVAIRIERRAARAAARAAAQSAAQAERERRVALTDDERRAEDDAAMTAAATCRNASNPHHTCSDYCREHMRLQMLAAAVNVGDSGGSLSPAAIAASAVLGGDDAAAEIEAAAKEAAAKAATSAAETKTTEPPLADDEEWEWVDDDGTDDGTAADDDDDDEEFVFEDLDAQRLDPWDALCLYRLLPLDAYGRCALPSLMASLSILATDADDRPLTEAEEKMSERALKYEMRLPLTKLDVAWRVLRRRSDGSAGIVHDSVDDNNRSRLSHEQLRVFCHSLIEGGHFDRDHLVTRTAEWWPPRFRRVTADDLVARVYQELQRSPTPSSASSSSSSSSSLSPLSLTPSRRHDVSLAEFKRVLTSLTTRRQLDLWYLVNPMHGWFKLTKARVREHVHCYRGRGGEGGISIFDDAHPDNQSPLRGEDGTTTTTTTTTTALE